MPGFDHLIREYSALSYRELLDFARRCYRELEPALKRPIGKGSNGDRTVLMLFAACLGADGRLTPREHSFICELMEIEQSYEDTLSLIRGLGAEECRRVAVILADSMPAPQRASLISLCLCFLAADTTVTVEEADFIRRLMA